MKTNAHPRVLALVGGRILTASLVPSPQAALTELAEAVPPLSYDGESEADPRLYFASVLERDWAPRVVAVQENGQFLGLVYIKERKLARLNTGLLLADGSLTKPVLSDKVNREDVLCAAILYMFSRPGVRGLRMLIPPEGPEMAAVEQAQKALLSLDVEVFSSPKARHSHLALPPTYEEFLAALGKNGRRNFRRYRLRSEHGRNQYVEHVAYDEFAKAAAYLAGKCKASGRSSTLLSTQQCVLNMLAVARRPLLAGLRDSDGRWLAILGGWYDLQNTTVVLQLNDDSGYPHDSLSIVLRSYVIEMLIARGMRRLIFRDGSSAPLASHCSYEPVVAVHLNARTRLWRLFRYGVARIAPLLPQLKNATVWIAPPAAARIKTLQPDSSERSEQGRGDARELASQTTAWRQTAVKSMSQSRRLRRYLGRPYLRLTKWMWNHLPASLTSSGFCRAYGAHLHRLVQFQSTRMHNIGTFFFRNRPELELLSRFLDSKPKGASLDLTILGCSKGAEVYSYSYSIRRARPDLKIKIRALDIDPDVLGLAEGGIYSLESVAPAKDSSSPVPGGDLASRTFRDQGTSVFERMSSDEITAMFECEGGQASVKPQYREGIIWHLGDAGDPKLVDTFGLQDIVVANRFLCHMQPKEAETCLRNLAHLVKPGGYLFVSGVDLGVRTKVARDLHWTPITELISEIHEGDPSLRQDWPMQYWGLEPMDRSRSDWRIRYASVFQLGEAPPVPVSMPPCSQIARSLTPDPSHSSCA